jgi:cytidine deaminase
MDAETQHQLIAAASAARAHAYAPYSKFQVGAAVLGASGRVFTGCNVENVSYGLTSCAERNAIFRAVVEGERRFSAVAVVTAAESLTPPCGACRQVLVEFAHDGDMEVILANLRGDVRSTQLNVLLPEGFSSFTPTSS